MTCTISGHREILIVLLLIWTHSSTGRQTPTDPGAFADTLYINGNILTGEGLTGSSPRSVNALAIRDGLIMATGTEREMIAVRGPKTEVIDLGGAFAMPGINDAHVHLGSAGRMKLTIDLTAVKSLADMKQRISVATKTVSAGTWLRGRGWDHTLWASRQLPSKEDIDSVSEGHPAVFTRVDGHIGVVNSAALLALGVTRDTPDPAGGKYDRDQSGNPTGIVRETALESVYNKIPPFTHEQRKKALELALADAVANGLTSGQDNSDWEDFLIYEELERERELPLRITEWLSFDDPVDVLKLRRSAHAASDPMLHTGMLKGFMDGSLGSRTAALNSPYSDDPGNFGIPRYDQTKLNEMTIERTQAGFQIGFHAIGDRAVAMALNAFAAAEAVAPKSRSLRFRIEHTQVVDPRDFGRFRRLAVIASMQPNHLLTDMNWAEARISPTRARYSYAWKTFVDQGTVLPFGTDYPVEPVTPFRGIYCAVTRRNEAGTMTYHPEQVLTMGQALYAYTQASAYAEDMDAVKGKLVPGQFADFVVLDQDLTKIQPSDILRTQVLRTVVGGRTVFLARVSSHSVDRCCEPKGCEDSALQDQWCPQTQHRDRNASGRGVGAVSWSPLTNNYYRP